jgi:hypothetical protein
MLAPWRHGSAGRTRVVNVRRPRRECDLSVGCPNRKATDQHLRALADELGLRMSYRKIESPDEADALGFLGSPTVLIAGLIASRPVMSPSV